MQLTRTRYSVTNVILLLAGSILCLLNTFLFVMSAGFGADPIHDLKTAAAQGLIMAGLLGGPAFLLMFRWCGIGSKAVWCVAASCTLIALIGGVLWHMLGLLILLLIEALISGAINAGSETVPESPGQSQP
jgi:hypothetical protein